MRLFCRLYGELDRSEGTRARVEILARHFQSVDPADAAWALQLLLGKQRRRLITARRLRQVAQRVTGLPDWLLEASHAQVGDTAETIALLLAAGRSTGPAPQQGSGHSGAGGDSAAETCAADWPLQRWMENELPRLAALEEEPLARALAEHWSGLSSEEILVLNKLLTGAFRVGVGAGLVVKALARISGLEETLLQHRLMGSFTATAASFSALLAPQEGEGLPSSRPYPFLLACPFEPERPPPWQAGSWLVEWKWDGIRAQLIRRGGESFLWSRGEELINASFPDLLSSIDLLPPGTVLDGELLIWPQDGQQPQPFAQLQRRLGRRKPSARVLAEAPACCLVYDLLELEGRDRRNLPLEKRRALLEELLGAISPARLRLSTRLPLEGWHELESLRSAARSAGAEGLMLKSLDGAYASGRRRGVWWKHKLEPLRLDAVLLYARNGSGRRANLYTDYNFALWHQEEVTGERRLVSFASAYSGLSDAELITIDRWIRRHTTERFGPVRAVAPELVFELAFEGVQRSSRHKSGIAVRFPRISRWRQDKP
ncbi:MAG: ATP-dependent DNA ligase, partial [Cyanobium sp.]